MAEEEQRHQPLTLLLRVSTLSGVVYEKYVDSVKVRNKDGVFIINRNYSPILEQLVNGEILVRESNNNVIIKAEDSWLTVSRNRCNIYSHRARVVGVKR